MGRSMTARQLVSKLTCLGIRLQRRGGTLRYTPRSAVTPDLLEQLKVHKTVLLEMLDRVDLYDNDLDGPAIWQAALDTLEGDPEFPPDVISILRQAHVRWAVENDELERS